MTRKSVYSPFYYRCNDCITHSHSGRKRFTSTEVYDKFNSQLLVTTFVQTTISRKLLSTHRHFSTKLMLITARSSTTTQRLHSFKFTLVNKSHSQHSEAAVRCLGRHFLILYPCAHEVSFPDQRPRSLVWKREYTSERARDC